MTNNARCHAQRILRIATGYLPASCTAQAAQPCVLRPFKTAPKSAVQAPLSALAELASPLLVEGGYLIAWKGEAEPDSERAIEENGEELAMEVLRQEVVVPFEGSRERRLYVLVKNGPTPKGLPRRPGMARKRPLGGR